FEHGLMIKTKDTPNEKKQVFKEKGSNITNKSEASTAPNDEKNKALEMLRNVAQQIKKNDKKKESEDEIEEDLLQNLEGLNEKEKTEEEEY
ncbi:MAG: hypothetical protein WCW13_02385, partial [archaeon]